MRIVTAIAIVCAMAIPGSAFAQTYHRHRYPNYEAWSQDGWRQRSYDSRSQDLPGWPSAGPRSGDVDGFIPGYANGS